MMKNKVTKTTYELVSKLRTILDDPDFIFGILVYADTEKSRKAILDFINAGEDVDVETVTVLALDLNDETNE